MSSSSSFLSLGPRKLPKQPRGERRVAELLRAAEKVFAREGYKAATASAIAAEAGASIGSLYQFFPNKEAIALALRRHYGKEIEAMLASLGAAQTSLRDFVDQMVDQRIAFLKSHPALLILVEEASLPPMAGARLLFQKRIAEVLMSRRKAASRAEAMEVALAVLYMQKALVRLYLESPPASRKKGVAEFKKAIFSYLAARWV